MKKAHNFSRLNRLIFGAVCFLAGSIWSCYMPTNSRGIGAGPREVTRLPNFSLTTLSGETVDSEDYHQKVLLVDFWATWCAPCVEEIPHLNDLYSDFRSKGVEVLGISMDSGDPEIVRRFTERLSVKYQIALGDSSVGEDFGGVQALPTTFIVDRQGRIVKRYDGYRPDYVKDMRRTIEQLLG